MAYVFVLTDCFLDFFDTALQFRTVVNMNMTHISADWCGRVEEPDCKVAARGTA